MLQEKNKKQKERVNSFDQDNKARLYSSFSLIFRLSNQKDNLSTTTFPTLVYFKKPDQNIESYL